MMFSYLQILCAITITLANTEQEAEQEGDKGMGGPVNYEFGYNVNDPNSEDVKSHHEIREGKNVYGFYTFKEADGTVRVVKYKVGPTTGFEATVEKLNPGQQIVITKPDDGQDPQGTGYVEQNVLNEVDGQVVPQYVGGGSRSQYVLGIINNPIQDAPVQAQQGYEQAPAPAPYAQKQNNARGSRRGNQYAPPTPSRSNRRNDYGHRQVHGYRQPQPYVQAQPAYNQYPAPQYPQAKPARTRNSKRRNNGYVNVQEQRTNVHNIRNNGGGGKGQAVNQDYVVHEEQENLEDQNNNAAAKDEGEQEAEDKHDFEKDFKAALEDDEDDEHIEEGESENLEEEEEADEELVEEGTEKKEKNAQE